jgi:hypothetical protein
LIARKLIFAIAMVCVCVAVPGSGAHSQTLYLDCARAEQPEWCRASQAQQREEENAFRRRDYTAMRNRAFCLWTGCDGAVKIDRSSSCVVRRVIMRHPQADRGDESHLANCVRAGQ